MAGGGTGGGGVGGGERRGEAGGGGVWVGGMSGEDQGKVSREIEEKKKETGEWTGGVDRAGRAARG